MSKKRLRKRDIAVNALKLGSKTIGKGFQKRYPKKRQRFYTLYSDSLSLCFQHPLLSPFSFSRKERERLVGLTLNLPELCKALVPYQSLEAFRLSATFSELLLDTFDSPIIIEKCNDIQCKRNQTRLFTHFMDNDRFRSSLSPLCLIFEEEDTLSLENQANVVSRWSFNGIERGE